MVRRNPATYSLHQHAWALFQGNELGKAGQTYRDICKKHPRDDRAWVMLGIIQARLGKYDDAVQSLQRAVSINPANFDAHINRGLAFYLQGQLEQSLVSLHRALALQPSHTSALLCAGNVYARLDRLTEATACYERVLRREPANAVCRGNLANVLAYQGRVDEAIASYRHALNIAPDLPGIGSNLLLCLHYSDGYDPGAVFQEHLAWGAHHTHGIGQITGHANEPKKDRRLRIGYLTPDFREHSLAYFFEPILAHHDRSRFEIYCYVNQTMQDATSKRLSKMTDTVCDISGLSDNATAAKVIDDGIDILVDLAGHTENNRLLVFARKPAPVQITYLGYPDTTGMSTIDYRLTDEWADPPGTTEHLHSERLIRLRHGFLSYRPSTDAPEITHLPSDRTGFITFGSFNVMTKITPRMLGVWARILEEVPQSRIFIKNRQLSDNSLQELIASRLEHHGIGRERIEMLGKTSREMHMAAYRRIDIALDTYPYNGTTTTCDTLWMGVPVVTLAGRSHVTRTGVSILSAVCLDALIATDEEGYVSRAVHLAHDVARLREMRMVLIRERMQYSRLCDGSGFTRELESVYRNVWKEWCDKAGVVDRIISSANKTDQ